MATRRSTIEVEVLGLAQLQALNTTLNTHDKRLQSLTNTYVAFNSAVNAGTSQMQKMGAQFVTVNNTVNNANRTFNTTNSNITNMGNAANRAGGQFGGMLTTMLQYRAVGAVFSGVTSAITATFDAMKEMEKQAARVQRVAAPGSTPGIRADIAVEAARTGASVQDIGEAYYQLKTQVKDSATAFGALQTAMNLVVGTESDARDTTRAMLQIYNQFGDQLGANVDQNEKLRRSGELLAAMWKGSAAEISEITNALKYLGPIAEAAHVPLEQVAATISALTFEGVRGRMGGTESAQLISQIIKNFNPATGMISNKGATLQAGLTPSGGLDLIQTMKNFNEVASKMPVATAQKFSQAISGTQNAWRLFGSVNPEFLRIIQQKLDDATKATHGLAHETDDLRKTMTTTAQEFQRVWGGAISAVSNMLDASGIRAFFKGIADDIERVNNIQRNIVGTNARLGGILAGQGGFPGDPNAGRQQARAQRATLQELLEVAHARGLSGSVTGTEMFGGNLTASSMLAEPLFDIYHNKTAQERGYLQQFMRFKESTGLLAGPGVRDVTFDLDAMQAEFDRLKSQLEAPLFGRSLPAYGPANPFSGGLHVKGGYTPPPDKEAEKAANEAYKKRLEVARQMAEAANLQYQSALKNYGPDDPRTKHAAQDSDRLAEMLARTETDTNEILRRRLKLSGDEVDRQEKAADLQEQRNDKQKEAMEAAAKQHAEALAYYAENAQSKYGLFSPETLRRTEEAQKAAEAVATGVDLMKLRDRSEGPMKVLTDKQAEHIASGVESVKAVTEAQMQYASEFAQEIVSPLDARIRGRERGLRPNRFGGTPDNEQEGFLKANIADIQKTLDLLNKNVPEASDQIAEMKARLADANAALVDFKDRVTAQAYEHRVQAEQDAYQLRNEEISHLHRLKFNKDEDSAVADGVRKYQELIVSAQKHLEDVKNDGGGVSERHNDAIRRAKKDVTEAQQNAADFKVDALIQKYQNVYGSQKATVHGALMDFFHGQGDAGTVVQKIGGSIVDAALESQIKRWSDPLVQTTTQQILEIQGNTAALKAATDAINGGGGGAGGGGGSSSGGDGTASKKRGGLSDLQKGITAGLAAYSIGAQSASQGVNAGNLIGGALAGSSIGATFGKSGGWIGALVGAGIDLIGGLFHHKSKPTATPQDLNPAFYNSPAGLNLAAYNYSAYGKLPTLQNVGFAVKPTNVPIVIVNIDGARVAAKQEISSQGSSVNVSLLNTTRNRYQPL